jgi:hypothetical protein
LFVAVYGCLLRFIALTQQAATNAINATNYYLNTSIQQSGQITAHIAQPKHPLSAFPRLMSGIPPSFKFDWRENSTVFAPRLFNLPLTVINFLGQKVTHNKQPLHFSLSMVILGML